jgi:hypothetical protein
MIEILQQSNNTCLAVHFSGKVTGEEYQLFLTAVDERLKNNERINLLVSLSDFDFYGDFESAKKDFKFAFSEYRHVQRAAFVGSQKWLSWFTHLIGPFTHAKEKHFSEVQFDEALAWATEG